MRDRNLIAALVVLAAGVASVVCAALGVDVGHIGALPVPDGVALAAVVQSTYTERMQPAVAGMIANMTTCDVDTRIVENSDGVPFGRAVGRGVADRGCRLGAGAATDFLGISVRDVTLAPVTADSAYVDEYQQRALAGILFRGDIWVQVESAVVDGADVTFNTLTGKLSSAAAGGSQFAITGARWLDTQATVNGLARVRLSGALPSA